MKKSFLKKTLGLLLVALVFLGCSNLSVNEAEGQLVDLDAERAISSASNLSVGTINKNTDYGDFTVLATSSKVVKITSTSTSYGGKTYSKAWDLQGGANGVMPTYRAFKFNLSSGEKFTAIVNANSNRTLQLSNGNQVVDSFAVTKTTNEYSYTAKASGTYYLYSKSSSLRVFAITKSGSASGGSSSGSGSSSGGSSGGGASSSESLSISQSKTQNGVGACSRLREITSVSQIKNAIQVSSASALKAALNSVSNGGAIVLSKGTYSFSETLTISSSNNGSSSAMKYVIAAPGTTADQVILDFSGQSLADSNRGIQLFGDWWHFYGITIKGAGDNGMYVSGNNNIVENCIFVENRDTGLQIARESSSLSNMSDWPANNLILNCTSYDNADKTGENADGFACKLTAGNGNVFDGCIAYSNSDDGWDLYAKEVTGPIGVVTIKNCIAFNNGKLTTGSTYGNGDMNGFKLGGSNGKVPTAHIVSNCVAFSNGHDGFTDNGNGGSLKLTNCTSYNNEKVNFNFGRTNKGEFTGLVTASPKNSDKYGTSSVASTLSKTLYFTNGKYYWLASETAITNGKKNVGTVVGTPSFKSTSLPSANTTVHSSLRNADGTIKLGNILVPNDSNYIGARFSTQAATLKGVSLYTK